jgi:hypothetical protein
MSCCVQSRIEGGLGGDMIEMRRAQLRFGDGLIAEEVWAATIKVRTNDNQDENVPVGAGRREGVARP